MTNLATAIKQEISRLARREARGLIKSLHRASAQFRRDIAELKRRDLKAQSKIAWLQRQATKGVSTPIELAGTRKVRFTVASVRAQRKRLGISAADYGKLIGVTGHTVYKWEHGASKPRSAQLAALAALRSIGKSDAKQRLKQLAGKAPKLRRKVG